MKPIRILSIFLMLLLLLTACDVIPAMADIETESQTETAAGAEAQTDAATETETDAETLPPDPKKRVAITFDDGPAFDNDTVQNLTYKIVDEFQKYGGEATFFILGNRINATTGKALQYAHARGFEFAIHGYTHDIYYDTCTEQEFLDELRQTERTIAEYIDAEVTLLRTPGGRITKERAVLSGYPIINWNIDTKDWLYKSRTDAATTQANIQAIVDNALRDVSDGDIILLHEIYQNSYEALCVILARLDQMGFEFVTVTELIGKKNLVAGETYYSAP